ncbi:hypothetical protein ACSBR2_038099 [Camellia fascicularis]
MSIHFVPCSASATSSDASFLALPLVTASPVVFASGFAERYEIEQKTVNPKGMECQRIKSHLPDFLVSELLWAWEYLSVATICRSSVIVYDGEFIFQIEFVAASPASDREAVPVDANNLMQGSLYQSVLKSGSLILRPLGDKGIAIIGGDTIRDFTTSDQ